VLLGRFDSVLLIVVRPGPNPVWCASSGLAYVGRFTVDTEESLPLLMFSFASWFEEIRPTSTIGKDPPAKVTTRSIGQHKK
jgi:hypothetical protein